MKQIIFVCAVLAAAMLSATGMALAGERISHETAAKLLADGKIRPLDEILAMLREKVPGRLLETELEYDDDGIVYDFKILRANGRVQEVEVLAATGKILEIEDDD